MTAKLSIDLKVLEHLTRFAPPYIYEILIEAQMSVLREIETGFILQIQPKTRNQLLILLQEESVVLVLRAMTQLVQPDVLRLCHQNLKRDVPVRDFLSFCD